MSKPETTKKKRKTRLKGTETRKPCVDCGKMKDRFKDFRPRWAGCQTHRNDKGRRYYQEGCDDCAKIVNGNIRQPRCIGCDKARPKKRKKAAQEPTPTPTATVETAAQPEVNVDPNPTIPPTPADKLPETEPKLATVEPEAEPVTVEPQAEASEASEDVTPEPAPAPERPKIASMSDLTKLFGGE